MKLLICYLTTLLFSLYSLQAISATKAGRVVETSFVSKYLEGNLIGINPTRTVKIYLPPSYHSSKKSYPVIYYFHSIFGSPEKMFEDGQVKALFDQGIQQHTIGEFILVAADFNTPHVGTFFGNTEVTGRWLDLIVKELVPFVDSHYRTLAKNQSRGLAGDFLGGYIALKLAMFFPEHFSAVYALHPVGTGSGLIPMSSRPDWKKMNLAKSWDDLQGDVFSQVFVAMAQAYLPNPNRPPFYTDWMVELQDGKLVLNEVNAKTLQSQFLLDQLIPDYVTNLKKLAGIKFDWGRYDANQDHVYANQAFTRKLDEYGVAHEAEEYNGNHWEKNWIKHGRVADELLPFFNKHLVF